MLVSRRDTGTWWLTENNVVVQIKRIEPGYQNISVRCLDLT